MKRKLYIKPSITTVEIEAMSIMAGSIGDGGGTGNIGDLEPGYGGGPSLHRATTSTRGSMMTATKRMSINNTKTTKVERSRSTFVVLRGCTCLKCTNRTECAPTEQGLHQPNRMCTN